MLFVILAKAALKKRNKSVQKNDQNRCRRNNTGDNFPQSPDRLRLDLDLTRHGLSRQPPRNENRDQ